MDSRGLVSVILFLIFFVAAVLIGNFLITTILGIPIDKVPAQVKAVVQLVTLVIMAFIAKSLFYKG